MWQDAHDAYLESRVLSADPIELVRMLYESAARGVENARRHLANGDIAARARSISHVSAVLIELTTSLDHERGGKISADLAQLYDYMLRRLTEANLQQSDAPLAEVQGLIATLSDGWKGLKSQTAESPEAAKHSEPDPPAWTEVRTQDTSSSESSWASYGGSWQPSVESTAYESRTYEPSTYARPWEAPVNPEPAFCHQDSSELPMAAAPVAPSEEAAPVNDASPWLPPTTVWDSTPTPSSWEPAPAYGASWANLVAQESASSYAHHDWSA